MFCPKCGVEYWDDRKWCDACGTNLQGLQAVPDGDIEAGPINRKALLVYLYTVRGLEFTQNSLESELKQNLATRGQLGKEYYIYKRTKSYTAEIAGIPIGIFLIWLGSLLRQGYYMYHGGGTALIVIGSILAVGCVLSTVAKIVYDVVRYTRETKAQEERLREEHEKIQRLKNREAELKVRLQNVRRELDKAYAVNWIPDPCRSVYGAWYLYNYLSTSNVSFNEALFHFDLDRISRELNQIMEMQQRMITELAYTNARMDQVVEQNQNILQSALRQERNQERMVEYQKVANSYLSSVQFYKQYEFLRDN
ncbi:MAG: zinc ribbon domain-containing protein [Clostridia bacterium]|nr:zinc ribbon domain-containing protein [Clostridia bacterium]